MACTFLLLDVIFSLHVTLTAISIAAVVFWLHNWLHANNIADYAVRKLQMLWKLCNYCRLSALVRCLLVSCRSLAVVVKSALWCTMAVCVVLRLLPFCLCFRACHVPSYSATPLKPFIVPPFLTQTTLTEVPRALI